MLPKWLLFPLHLTLHQRSAYKHFATVVKQQCNNDWKKFVQNCLHVTFQLKYAASLL